MKVTGDDEIEKFESEFPDIDVGPVSGISIPGHNHLVSKLSMLNTAWKDFED